MSQYEDTLGLLELEHIMERTKKLCLSGGGESNFWQRRKAGGGAESEGRLEKLRARLRSRVQDRLDLSRELTDEEVQALIDEEIMACSRSSYLLLEEKLRMQKELFHAMRRLDILQELIEDPEVTEIMVNGTGSHFYREEGQNFPVGEEVFHQNTAGRRGAADCQLLQPERDQSQPHSGRPPRGWLQGEYCAGPGGPEWSGDYDSAFSGGAGADSAAGELGIADGRSCGVSEGRSPGRLHIFVSGGTGSGKTTFLNALSEFIPETARVITIEDNAELQLDRVRNLVTLEARGANLEGEREITIRDLIRTALRMRPDRIIVGEVRGAEAIDMLQAMNTGHDGSLSTGHANSPRDMLSRLETMVLMGMELPLMAIRDRFLPG